MNIGDKVINAAFESDEVFQQRLSKVIKEELGLTALEFSKQADIPSSTLYKILSGKRSQT